MLGKMKTAFYALLSLSLSLEIWTWGLVHALYHWAISAAQHLYICTGLCMYLCTCAYVCKTHVIAHVWKLEVNTRGLSWSLSTIYWGRESLPKPRAHQSSFLASQLAIEILCFYLLSAGVGRAAISLLLRNGIYIYFFITCVHSMYGTVGRHVCAMPHI